MMDWTCTECERLWDAYEHAAQSHQIMEHNSALETGLEVLVRKASNRYEQARKDFDDHEATHMFATALAIANG